MRNLVALRAGRLSEGADDSVQRDDEEFRVSRRGEKVTNILNEGRSVAGARH